MTSTGWITKDDAASSSAATGPSSTQTNDLASRLGGFGLKDSNSNGAASTQHQSQTVSDGWTNTSTPAATASTSNGPAADVPAKDSNATTGNGDEAAAPANGEVGDMSNEDGQSLLSVGSSWMPVKRTRWLAS